MMAGNNLQTLKVGILVMERNEKICESHNTTLIWVTSIFDFTPLMYSPTNDNIGAIIFGQF